MKTSDERKALENLIKNSPTEIKTNVPIPGEDIPELQPVPIVTTNFKKLKKKCEKEATTMIKNAISFMIPLDMIKENKYIHDKFKVDVMSLAGMIYQLRSNEVMQNALMEQIVLGLTHPRYWEVYTGMSKSIGDLNKQLLQTVEAIKETYRSFKNDVKEQRTEIFGPQQSVTGMLTTGDGGVVTRGTKELINQVKLLKSQNINEYLDEQHLIPNIPIEPQQ